VADLGEGRWLRECVGRRTPAWAPRLASLSRRTPRESEAGGERVGRQPAASADLKPPASLSSLLLLGLHRIGGSTDEVDLPVVCNAGRRVDDVLDAGPRRRRRTGESLRHLPLRQGWLGPALHFCASTSRLPMPLQKANGPVPDPEPFPRRSIGPTTGARGMSIYPRRGPINTDDLWAAINPLQPKVGK
jgi:hypothetical protein